MKIKTAIVYTFSFNNPDDVEIFLSQCQRLAIQGYKPLFPPTVFNDTVVQQWGLDEVNNKINSQGFRLFLKRGMMRFDKKWDNRQWMKAYEDFDEWLKGSNSVWSSNKSANALYRSFAIERYANADILTDGYCIKGMFK